MIAGSCQIGGDDKNLAVRKPYAGGRSAVAEIGWFVNPGWDLIHHVDEYRIMGIGESTVGTLDGKVAVVTGASKGIGAGIAKVLAAQGASVEEFSAIKVTGYTDQQLVGISLAIAVTVFTNVCNRITDTAIDFPAVA
jgi:hypothetical protein